MLHSSDVILKIVEAIEKIKVKKIVLDPVMVAKGGFKLINNHAIKTLRAKLVKKVYLITPNIPEAEVLTDTKIKNTEDVLRAAKFYSKLALKIF